MAYDVVCISATDGAMGEEIGALVAEALGFRLVNEQIVERAAVEAAIPADVIADVEQRGSVVERVIGQLLGTAARAPSRRAKGAVTPSSDSLRAIITNVIEDVAISRYAVIVFHAASHALADREDTLRVLVTAAADTRRDRIQAAHDVSESEAARRVARGDANRADYIKRFYGVSRELPTHYDLVVNSDRLSVQAAADVITRTVSA